ncbi:MAG: response regulator [Sulfurovum sp.]|nr:response regulator [Sulfurovum sp.]
MRILLLEDELMLQKNIEHFLKLQGHFVESYSNGETLLDNANLLDFDFFIFDINVPEIDGFELIRYIRSQEINTPLIFITAMVDIEDIKEGFELGCNDYIKKPFELHELEIRIKNILKQCKIYSLVKLSEDLYYDFDNKLVLKDDKPLDISTKQSEILYILMKNMGHVVSFETISSYVYNNSDHAIHTISSHIRDLRKLVGHDIIKNVRGIGYKLTIL